MSLRLFSAVVSLANKPLVGRQAPSFLALSSSAPKPRLLFVTQVVLLLRTFADVRSADLCCRRMLVRCIGFSIERRHTTLRCACKLSALWSLREEPERKRKRKKTRASSFVGWTGVRVGCFSSSTYGCSYGNLIVFPCPTTIRGRRTKSGAVAKGCLLSVRRNRRFTE